MTALRIIVLGGHMVGKSAATVRFLTKRFIGEYSSDTDFLYRSSIKEEGQLIDVEVLDTCAKHIHPVDEAKASWADAFVVVHSILSRESFILAKDLIQAIRNLRSSAFTPVLLLANMTDLDHRRQVMTAEGREYFEVSAAEDVCVALAFRTFLHEVRLAQQQLRSSSLKRRRSSLATVSRRLGAMFGKKDSANGGAGASNSNGICSGGGGPVAFHSLTDINGNRKSSLDSKDVGKT
ncbi:hypothetical protein RRG08_017234 [Elysia crispata]|uniref:small monomeric GTPase n=1 Tax=Elysia crispata TaxID=231223 RepID=A0AAE1D9R9_9GAST|nr:hypothetical protein RRG08_017234 [Elysia crispata]